MIHIAFDGIGFAGACGGVAAVITAIAGLVWAVRRHPGGTNEKAKPARSSQGE